MKKLLFLLLTLALILTFCDKQEIIPGEVGNPLYLNPMVENADDTLDCTYQWTFLSMPEESRLNVLSFQPTSREFNIFFVPDVVGEYLVSCSIIGPDNQVKTEKEFLCQVAEGTGEAVAQTPASEVKPQEIEIPEDIPGPVYEEEKKPEVKIVPTKPKVKPEVAKDRTIPKINGKFTIQMSSFKTYDKAEKAMTHLSNSGIDVYVQKAVFDNGEVWYRVRSGSFESYTKAQLELKRLQAKFPKDDIWIDTIRKD